MAKKVIEGYVVKQIIKSGEKKTEEIIGIEMSEYNARELILDRSEYYSTDPFRYESSNIHNGIAFTKVKSSDVIFYTYDKCEVIMEA